MSNISIGNDKPQDLEMIKKLTLDMFLQVEKMIELSKILLQTPNNTLALEIIEEDLLVDDLQNDIIVEVNNFIIMHEHNSLELRKVLGTYRLIADLERIGDNLKAFAKNLIKNELTKESYQASIADILENLKINLRDTKEAYEEVSHVKAKEISKKGKEVKLITKTLISSINTELSKKKDEKEIKALTQLLLLAKFFGRSDEHILNICEEISYIKKGQLYHYS